MIRVILGLILITVISEVIGQQGFVFEGETRRRRPIAYDDAGKPMRPGGVNPSTIDSIFQIPIAVIQGTSAVAQSFYPDNGETINKVFDIPVQTLHAVGNLIKDRYPPESEKNFDQNSKRDETQELETRRRIEEKERTRELQRLKRQQPFPVDQQDQSEGRRHHSFYDPLAWTDAFADLLVGHGGLFSGHGGHFGGHGGHNHGNLFGGHKKKKKKKKKPHGGHFQQLGGHNHGQGGHFGGHGQGGHFGSHGQGHGGHGGPQTSGTNNFYEVTENLDDIQPQQGFFSWFQPPRQSHPIQNKIAPALDNRSHSR